MIVNDAALIEPHRLVKPSGWVGHIPFASWITSLLQPELFVELGTHSGNSYSAFCQAIVRDKLRTRAFAIDTWKGDEHAGHYDDSVFLELQGHHDRLYGSFSTMLRTTFDDAVSRFADDSIDLLHIDGLHTYEAVKHDFESWLPKLSARAVVLFHDTCVFTSGFGVHCLWDELVQKYPGFNFKHSHGLGVLLVGSQRHEALLALASDDPRNEDWRVAFDLFRALGAGVERRARIADLEEAVAQRDSQVGHLNQSVAELSHQLSGLTAAAAAHGEETSQLQQAAGQRELRLVELTESAASQSEKINGLEERLSCMGAALAESEQHAAHLRDTLVEREGQLAIQTQTIADRDAQVASLTEILVSRDSQVESGTEAISRLNEKVDELGLAISVRVSEIADRDGRIASLEGALSAKEDEATHRDARIDSLEKALSAKEDETAQRDACLASLEKALSAKEDETAHRDACIASLKESFSSKEHELADRDERIASLESANSATGRELAQECAKIAALEAAMEECRAREAELLRYRSHWIFRFLNHPRR